MAYEDFDQRSGYEIAATDFGEFDTDIIFNTELTGNSAERNTIAHYDCSDSPYNYGRFVQKTNELLTNEPRTDPGTFRPDITYNVAAPYIAKLQSQELRKERISVAGKIALAGIVWVSAVRHYRAKNF